MKDRATDLRADYERLGELMKSAEGTAAANLARERRQLRADLERLGTPEEVSRVDELAEKRTKSGVSRPPSRRRKSG